jgi:hypothetical protein
MIVFVQGAGKRKTEKKNHVVAVKEGRRLGEIIIHAVMPVVVVRCFRGNSPCLDEKEGNEVMV